VHSRLPHSILLAFALVSVGCDRGAHPGQIGRPAPSISIPDGGRAVSLSQFRGRIVVLHFWASWCTYCLAEFPPLTELQQEVPGVVVLAVSFDQDPAAYRDYVIENHIGVRTLLDTSQRSNLAFGTTRPPETYIIDRQGVIRRKFIGAQDWASPEITGYLKQL
jgi:thiol-disulfide isomerase/thioredoxin